MSTTNDALVTEVQDLLSELHTTLQDLIVEGEGYPSVLERGPERSASSSMKVARKLIDGLPTPNCDSKQWFDFFKKEGFVKPSPTYQ